MQDQGLPVDPGAPEAEGSGVPDGGPGGILGGLLEGGAGGAVLGNLFGGGIGNAVLGHIFGSKDASREVASQALQQSGVDPSILKKLLPIVAGAVAMHYMSKRASAGSSDGGVLGSILGGVGR